MALQRIGFHFAVDPIDVAGDAGIDPGLVLLPTPITPADHAHQGHPVIVSTDEGTPRISLWLNQSQKGGKKNTIKNGKFCDIAQHYDPCDVLTLHASSRPRVSPAHSILEVTVRPDSTSGTQRSLGHRRTWPLLTRSEYSAETGDSNYVN